MNELIVTFPSGAELDFPKYNNALESEVYSVFSTIQLKCISSFAEKLTVIISTPSFA